MTLTIIHSANILTLNPLQPTAEALALENGRIRAVGRNADILAWSGSADEIIDARQATLVPGFIDAHLHFGITGLGYLAADLDGADSIPGLVDRIALKAEKFPKKALVVAINFQPELNPEGRWPTLAELDQAGGGRPVYLMERTGHISLVNSAAASLTHPALPAGIVRGNENSIAFTQLWERFANEADLPTALLRAAQDAVAGGITTIHALDDLDTVKIILDLQEQLPIRVIPYTQTKDVQAVKALGLRQIGGCGTVMVDGDFSPHTAALLEPYSDDPHTCGILYYSDAALNAYVLAAHQAGLQVALHCVGSAAIEQLLNAYELALQTFPRVDHRHRIEHFELPGPGQAQRARRLGVCLCLQPSFNHFWPHDQEYPQIVGVERAEQVDPLASLHRAGLSIALGSDSPVTPPRPILWLHSAANHSNPAERISAYDALRMATQGGSYAAFEDHEKGSLEPGKLADLVFLDTDPTRAPIQELKNIQVLRTIVAGKIVFNKINGAAS